MDWHNELYVKLYRRETDDDLLLPWEARALWHEMLKRFDRSGIIQTRRGAVGLAALVRIPHEVVERALSALLDDGRLSVIESGYFAPNYVAAQEANKSNRLRQAEFRDKRKQLAASQMRNGIPPDVTQSNGASRGVTESNSDLIRSDLSRSEQNRSEQNARARVCFLRDFESRVSNGRPLRIVPSVLVQDRYDVFDGDRYVGLFQQLPDGSYQEAKP